MVYSTKLGEKICERTAGSSIGLRHICKELGMPYSTVTNWIYDEDHELHEKYAHAKFMQLGYLADEILEIADDSSNDYMTVVKNGKTKQVLNREAISRSNLRIRARLALIAKLSPILRDSKPGKEQKGRLMKITIKEVPPVPLPRPITSDDDETLGPQYDQPGTSPVEQAQTSQSIYTKSKNIKKRKTQKKVRRSSPKNTPPRRPKQQQRREPAPVQPPLPSPEPSYNCYKPLWVR